MKILFFFLFCLAACRPSFAQTGERKYISPNSDSGYILGPPEVFRFHPGDTIVLRSRDSWSYFALEGFRGDPARPLVVINEGGQVRLRDGFRFMNDSYVKLTGRGAGGTNGFLIEQDPVFRYLDGGAIQVGRRSKNIELEQVYIHNCAMGFVCESAGDCADSLNYPNWVLDSISIHDCRIVGTWNEGMYIGNTSPDNGPNSYDKRPVECGGKIVYPMPMRNGNIRVYNNYVDSTGRGGIQLASASTGMSEISHNIVRHSGMNGDDAQGTGISVGAYTRVYIHDNIVSNTYTWGIASLGGSGTGSALRIEHNQVDSCGYLAHYRLAQTEKYKMDPRTEPVYPDELDWPHPIEVGTRPTQFTDSTMFWIRYNTFGPFRGKGAAIQVQDGYRTIVSSGNIICGNTNKADGKPATIYVDQSKGKVSYADCTGTTRTAGWSFRTLRRRTKWAIVLAVAMVVMGGLYYFVRGRRS